MEPDAVREVFRGHLIRVEVWSEPYREIVRHPGACAVAAITPEGEVVLIRQHRDPVGETLLEVPAGIPDRPAEDPAGCAARELFEETGYRAASMERLGWVYTSPGFSDERIELFVARTGAEPAGEPEEGIEVVLMPLERAVEAVREGRIPDAKTAVVLLLAASRRSGVGPTS